uniref:Retrovirus-related Pol polyprotein from transposon TNT 1-94 n=1 Tax=Tanacetum cinerariifolium TaxID=118510 RepID=A0A6L2MHH7_TANCI|nr:retrovirus-related Pol polyprotein from transposon TNT 1-94 [Tanacetum cinerariifolium]
MGSKKKTVMVTSDPLALIAEKSKVSKRKEEVFVSSESEASDEDDISELKKITALLAKAFNRRKFYSKPTNNNLRTSSASNSTNKKQEFIKSDDKKKEGHFTKDYKKAKVKDYEYYKTKMLLAKKDKDEQVLLAEDHAWMESSSDSDQEIDANMVFMAQIEKVLYDSEASSSSADDKISKVSYYLSKSKSESEFETLEYDNATTYEASSSSADDKISKVSYYLSKSESESEFETLEYDNATTYGLFVDNNDDQEIFHDCEIFSKNLIQSQIDHNESAVDNNDYEGIDKLIKKFNKKIAKCLKQLNTVNSVRGPKRSDVVWKNKGSSNAVKDNLSFDNNFNLNKSVKRYTRNNLMACNNFDTRSAVNCNNAKNALCNSYEADVNDLFAFDDVCIRKSPVSNIIFRKKPSASLNVHSRTKSNKSVSRTVSKWLLKMKPLAEPIVQICLWIIDFGCSKHMTGNRALLMNFVKKFLGTVRFGNNDFVVIAGYGDDNFMTRALKLPFESLHVSCETNMVKICLPVIVLHMGILLRLKDEASEVIISFIKKTQVNLQLQVQRVRTDNGTEFKNKTLAKFFDEVGISQQFSAARTPQQNSIVERRNRTLVEAARTMLTFANLPLFLWAEAIVTAYFTQNRSIIHKRFGKTPYELMNKRKPNIKFFHVFGCRCYLLNDHDDVGKLKAKGDIGVFVGYSKDYAAFRVYNKRARKIHASVNVNFDVISEMASKQFSLEPDVSKLNQTGKSSNQTVSQVDETSKKDLEDLF